MYHPIDRRRHRTQFALFKLCTRLPDEDPLIVTRRCLCRKRGACSYAAMLEASRFRAEALLGDRLHGVEAFSDRKPKRCRIASSSSSAWDCGSALYDSFELDSFSSQFGRRLAESNNDGSPLALLGSPRGHKRGCLPFLSAPANIFPISSRFKPSNLGAVMAFPPEFLRGKMKTAQFGNAFRKFLKTAAAAKLCFSVGCHPRSLIVHESNDDSRRPDHNYEHLHHHFHHHLHHYSVDRVSQLPPASNDNDEAQMATANLLKHFHAEASYDLSPQTLVALRREMDHHQEMAQTPQESSFNQFLN